VIAALLATMLEAVADLAFLFAPFSRRTTWILGIVLALLLALLGWVLLLLWMS
jgi:hypothetical protein